jgi:dipeptidyl aminopeptidase/acylaminoacyl peptidase
MDDAPPEDLTSRWLEVRAWRAFDVDDTGRVLAGHDDSGTVQLVELADGRSTALTALPGAVTGRWVPGRRSVLVSHDRGGDENAQLSLLDVEQVAALGRPAGLDELTPLVHADGVMHTVLHLAGDRLVYAHNGRNRVDFDVHVRDLGTGADVAVFTGGGMVSAGRLSPDGTLLALALTSLLPMSTHLVVCDVPAVGSAPTPPRPLTDPGEAGRHERLSWTPDSGALLYATDRDFGTTLVGRHDLATGRFTPVVAHDEWDVSGWLSPDGSLLLAETLVDGESRLALHDPATGRVMHAVDLPGAGTEAAGVVAYMLPEPVWSRSSSTVVLSFSAPGVPGDVLLLEATSGEVTALTDSAAHLPAPVALPQSHLVPAPDGERVPCFAYPAGPGATGSSVTVVHGGPEGQSVRTFNPVVQSIASAGHGVLVPNVRGSTGYGRRWYSLDDGPLRLDSVADLAAVHAHLPTLGHDPARAALWGGSYGGYMVLAGLTFQPDLWAAGVDIVGISSLVTFLENTSAYRRAFREREYGRLETDREMLEAASPLPRIDRVRAPLFVIHGANDPRVPLSEAEQVVAAVRAKGLECELRVYDDEGHGLAKRANRLDAYPAAIACLGRWLA